MTKTSVSLCISVTALHMVFGTHVYNVDISSNLFSVFQKSYFLVFSNFTNKYQKEILRYVPPSSHICDFLVKIWLILSQLELSRTELPKCTPNIFMGNWDHTICLVLSNLFIWPSQKGLAFWKVYLWARSFL